MSIKFDEQISTKLPFFLSIFKNFPYRFPHLLKFQYNLIITKIYAM